MMRWMMIDWQHYIMMREEKKLRADDERGLRFHTITRSTQEHVGPRGTYDTRTKDDKRFQAVHFSRKEIRYIRVYHKILGLY